MRSLLSVISNQTLKSLTETPNWFILGIVTFSLFKIWLVSAQSLYAIGPAGHDDRLFLILANNIIHGDWLGKYNELTLAKGPFYSIWIAFTYIVGLPLLLAQHLLYLIAALATLISIKPLTKHRLLLFLLFILILFNPMSFDSHISTRVIRAGIYPALTLFTVVTCIGIYLRRSSAIRNLLPWALASGFSFAAFWLTREEGIWLIPLPVSLLLLTIWQSRHVEDFKQRIIIFTLPFMIPIVIVMSISAINKMYYDVYAIVEFDTKEFKDAYGALSRVKHAEWRLKIPLPVETRDRIYEISPAFAELKPYFERKGFFTSSSKKKLTIDPKEIYAHKFMWALRNAVTKAGYNLSGSSSSAYYKRLSYEINKACEEKLLNCLPERSSMMPPWRDVYNERIFDAIIKKIFYNKPLHTNQISSTGSDEHLDIFKKLTLEKLSPRSSKIKENKIFVKILAAHSTHPLSIKLINTKSKQEVAASVKPSPEIKSFFKDRKLPVPPYAEHGRYEVTSKCDSNCIIQVETSEKIIATIPIKIGPSSWFNQPLWVYIEDVVEVDGDILRNLKIDILKKIGIVYQYITPVFITLSILVYLKLSWNTNRDTYSKQLWVITTLIIIVIVLRIVILSLIDATSFHATDTIYVAPIFPLVILFYTLMILNQFTRSSHLTQYPKTNC
ncbi:MAG: hypothetical protein ABW100_15435 [Candidatus Thiodiazotropha sp. 6PLUC3]